MELIRKITKMGNSSHVVLPKEWLNGRARVELIEKPANINEDVLRILNPHLKDILGIYLVGSYARKEETKDSDVDVLVVTDDLDKKIKEGKYEIILISKDNLDKSLKRNILPLLPMLREAKTIMNKELLEKYKNTKINKENTKWIIDLTKSSRKICKIAIEMSKEDNKNISDGVAYSLILGLRTIYVLDCLKKNKTPTSRELKNLVIHIVKTEEPYNSYLRSKNSQPEKMTVSPEIGEKLNNYIIGKL